MIAYVYLFSFFLGFLFFFSVGKKYGTNWDNCLPLTGFCNTNGQWLPVILTDPHPWWFNVKSRYSNPQQRSNICTTGNDGEKHRNTSSILEILFIPVLSFLGLPCPTQNRRTVTKCLHHPIPTIGTLNQARTSCRWYAAKLCWLPDVPWSLVLSQIFFWYQQQEGGPFFPEQNGNPKLPASTSHAGAVSNLWKCHLGALSMVLADCIGNISLVDTWVAYYCCSEYEKIDLTKNIVITSMIPIN